ncbi:ATP-dependent zinc metalloprotease FtsH [Mobilicoccus pelagius]|uniref:ATP-dependent zinc metalloprotease FtsH n=1 Tax=Mobilicoccus pelagius NBRC 104925 TaxID=1089455 RepID=H5UT47_9MICO|nr:ATP-dependent zinc metalloprotease FtsH [Mobilicoccus pelagius]GAB48905.1 cell division protein FtsH [Mobilicoccus pelagius NBRC 104925]
MPASVTPPTDPGRRDDGPPRASRRQDGRGTRDDSPAPKPWRTEGMPEGGDPKKGTNWKWLALVMGLLWLLLFGVMQMQNAANAPREITYTEFTKQLQAKNVEKVQSKGDSFNGTLRADAAYPGEQGVTYKTFTTERPTWAKDDIDAMLKASNATISAKPVAEEASVFWTLLISFGPILLIVGLWILVLRKSRSMMTGGLMGGNKKKAPVDPESVRVTFDDVAGIDEVENEIYEIVDFLKNPDKYRRLGARAPKGVLLAGQPGTGKTLLARATAGEAEVPFFSASASEFIEMIVGVGAQRVRELFEEARKVAPSIIFIDEIDTIGRARGGSRAMGGHDEREQTLNQILTEMDGFSGSEGVVVLAATNRADVLDPALLRPGRFDRTIQVHAPDAKGREQILQVHTRGVPLGKDVDLTAIAKATPGMTGAELANLVNEAALAAARQGADDVTQPFLSEALEKVQLGAARNVVMPPEERRRTAYHEAGHALLGMLQPGADPVRKVSIIPRGRALGVTLSTPDDDRYGYDEEYLRGRIIGALGGMAAEELIFGVITTGAESDLDSSTNIARSMVGRWGMSESVGPVQIYPNEGDPRSAGFSEDILARADEEVRRIVDECYREAVRLLREHRDKLERITAAVLEKETLDEAEVYAAAGIERPSPEEIASPIQGSAEVPERDSAPTRVDEPTRFPDSGEAPQTGEVHTGEATTIGEAPPQVDGPAPAPRPWDEHTGGSHAARPTD